MCLSVYSVNVVQGKGRGERRDVCSVVAVGRGYCGVLYGKHDCPFSPFPIKMINNRKTEVPS